MAILLVAIMAFETVAQVAPYKRDPVYDGISQTSQYIKSFDGTRLAVTVIRPTLKGKVVSEPLPVIMYQDRNMMGDFMTSTVRFFTDRGYVFVLQERRGTGASFGFETGFLDENVAKDAVATIEWAGTQPFCNKKVVALGCSNQGGWQYVIATKAPKYLVAIAPACSSPQFFDHGVSMNGINIYQVNEKPYAGKVEPAPTAMTGGKPPRRMPRPVDADTDSSMLKTAIAEHTGGAPMLGQYWLNMPRDGYNEYAKCRPALDNIAITHADAIKKSGIAILQLMGWFDACVAGGIEGQRAWNGRLIFGPWVHGNSMPRGASYTNGNLDLNAEMLQWFDFYAKGIKNGANQAGIKYYTINAPAGNEWNETPVWPPKGTIKTAYFMTEKELSTTKPGAGGQKVVYNQQDVLWFGGKNKYQPLNRWWNGDMNETDSKSITHTSELLTKTMEVTGTPVAKLWISADARDVNVFAVLEDVSPDGKATYVSDGRLRASWRKLHKPEWAESDQSYHRGFSEDITPLTPGEPVEMVFDFFPISYIFQEGHKIRVSIVTSLGEAYQLPPMAEGKAVSLTLYRDAEHPSAIVLPVIEGLQYSSTDKPSDGDTKSRLAQETTNCYCDY